MLHQIYSQNGNPVRQTNLHEASKYQKLHFEKKNQMKYSKLNKDLVFGLLTKKMLKIAPDHLAVFNIQ